MKRKIIAYKDYYKKFFDAQDAATQEKILYGLLLLKTQDRLPSKFVKPIRDGLYELRIEWQSNIYRLFFCFDEGRVVVLFNCFQKKSQKTPTKEINKAFKLKAEYEERKKHGDI
ncbi:MAG: type II toxin-antitoxin system RelE/ParE family toxin [Prevotella sp.]|nr:type II toxin-antitoxin system RelE/ParE family toxin [Prevotella sp.]